MTWPMPPPEPNGRAPEPIDGETNLEYLYRAARVNMEAFMDGNDAGCYEVTVGCKLEEHKVRLVLHCTLDIEPEV